MWKKQWNKLKTALSSPEDYVEEEVQQEEEAEELPQPEYNSDQVIPIATEDFAALSETINSIKMIKMQVGELTLKYDADRTTAQQLISQLNQKMAQQIDELRSTYNVEPTVDYALNFPMEDGTTGSFVRTPNED